MQLASPSRRALFCRTNMRKEDNIPKLRGTKYSTVAAWKQYI